MGIDLGPLEERIDAAGSLLAITGAGISAESGIPTYRGVAGLYEADEGAEIMRRLSYGSYLADPGATFRTLSQLLDRCRDARPNAAHRALAALQQRMRVTLLTQNVDGLHGAAGSRDMIEMHGNIRRLRCPRCAHSQTFEAAPEEADCPACGKARLRHDVVLFEEQLDPGVVARYQQAVTEPHDLCLVVGTTAMFPYIEQAALLARETGAVLVEINPELTALSSACDLVLRGKAAEILGAVGERFKK